MALITFPRRCTQRKPPLGTRVDWGHPLACGLVGAWYFNEGGGGARSAVHPMDELVLQGSGAWSVGGWGAEITPGGNSSGAKLVTPSALLKPTVVSIFVLATWNGGGVVANSPYIAGMAHNNANASPYVSYAINRSSSQTTGLGFLYDSGGSLVTLSSGTGVIAAGVPFSAALCIGVGDVRGYANAVEVANSATAAGVQYGATCQLDVGRTVTGTENPDTDVAAIYVWNRQLSRAEIQWLHAEPFALAVARTPRYLAVNPLLLSPPAPAGEAMARPLVDLLVPPLVPSVLVA